MRTDESTEIFDDLYLGLRAGGAMRKKRRGEPLTHEEQEALGRWQRLSTWRKAVAIGGFARRDVRPRLHARRPRLRPLAQGLARALLLWLAEQDGRDFLFGRILVADDHVESVDDDRGERDRRRTTTARRSSSVRHRHEDDKRREPDGVAQHARHDHVVLELPDGEHGDAGQDATCTDAVSPTPTATRRPQRSDDGTSSTSPANAPTRSQYGSPASQNAGDSTSRRSMTAATAAHVRAELQVDQHHVSRETLAVAARDERHDKPTALSRSKIQYAAEANTKRAPIRMSSPRFRSRRPDGRASPPSAGGSGASGSPRGCRASRPSSASPGARVEFPFARRRPDAPPAARRARAARKPAEDREVVQRQAHGRAGSGARASHSIPGRIAAASMNAMNRSASSSLIRHRPFEA